MSDPAASPDRGGLRASSRWRTVPVVAIIILVALLTGVGTGVSVTRRAPIYESFATMLIDQPRAVAIAGNEGVLVKLQVLRGKYLSLIKTDPIVAPVAARLGLSKNLVRDSTLPGAPGASLVMFIASRTRNSLTSQRIANGLAAELTTFLKVEQDRLRLPANQRIELSTVTPAGRGVKVSPTDRDAATKAGIAAGLVLLIGLALQTVAAFRRS